MDNGWLGFGTGQRVDGKCNKIAILQAMALQVKSVGHMWFLSGSLTLNCNQIFQYCANTVRASHNENVMSHNEYVMSHNEYVMGRNEYVMGRNENVMGRNENVMGRNENVMIHNENVILSLCGG